MGVTNHLLTPSWYHSRGHGKGNWREILLCKGNNNYHSQLIHGKKYLYHSDGTKVTKDINSKYPQSFLTSILRTRVFFLAKSQPLISAWNPWPKCLKKYSIASKRGWWQPKNACVLASKGVMLTLKKTYQKGYPRMNKYRPWKGWRIISWKEMFIDINSIDFKAPFCYVSEE